jgi:hypothetical protein
LIHMASIHALLTPCTTAPTPKNSTVEIVNEQQKQES